MTVTPYAAVIRRCFVNAPWYDLKDNLLDLFIEYGLQPEISLEGTCLYDEDIGEFKKVHEILAKNGLECTLHAPFFDLAPGSLDPYILDNSREKLYRAVDLAAIFQPKSIVCHMQYEENKHGYVYDRWRLNSIATWRQLADRAAAYGVPIMLENTYETSPATHQSVLAELPAPAVGFCLDVGHLGVFAKASWTEWLPAMLPWLGQLHLHDNTGEQDQHLAPGLGTFDFPGLFDYLRRNDCHPLITLEPHTREDLWQALAYLDENDLLTGI
jgi:sugar phosphate isomerase/epimerase